MSTYELKKKISINDCQCEKNNKVNYSTIKQFKTKKYRPNIV